jgi:hypothetical protein
MEDVTLHPAVYLSAFLSSAFLGCLISAHPASAQEKPLPKGSVQESYRINLVAGFGGLGDWGGLVAFA